MSFSRFRFKTRGRLLPIVESLPADFIVTNDSEFSNANSTAVGGQIIELADNGTFTDLTLTNATGVTVRGETPGVPVVRSFHCQGCTGATVRDFSVHAAGSPVSSSTSALVAMNNTVGSSVDGLVIEGLRVRAGDPDNSMADFDPTFNDADKWGTDGAWGSENVMLDYWTGIGVNGGSGLSAPSGDITIRNCEVTDLNNGVKFSYAGGGSLRINGNRIGRTYGDAAAVVMVKGGAEITGLEYCGNEVWDNFSQPQDNRNPHADLMQFAGNDASPFYEHPIRNVLIAGNIFWYTPGTRGQPQRVFCADFAEGYPMVAPIIVDNLLVSRITSKGIEIAEMSGATVLAGTAWAYIGRNTIAANPSNNAHIQNEQFTNSVTGAGPLSNPLLATINVPRDPAYTNSLNYVFDNVTEQITTTDGLVTSGNLQTGRGSNATSYGSHANPDSDAEWNALADADDYLAAFQTAATYGAGKGVGIAGTTAAAIRAAWADPDSRPWADLPSWVGWINQTDVDVSTQYESEFAFVHAGGPGNSRSFYGSGGEYRTADDKDGMNETAWATLPDVGSPGTIAHGKYLALRRTSSSSHSTAADVDVTIGSDTYTWRITTEAASEYPIVAFDGSDRFLASGAVGSDNRYLSFAFKAKFPASNPGSTVNIFNGINTAAASTGPVIVSLLSTGLIRVFIYNASGTQICQLNMTSGSLCDGGTHEIMIDIDMDQATAANGRQIYIDGSPRTSATGAWSGGSGVQIGYSRTTNQAGSAIGGIAASMLNDFEVSYVWMDITSRIGVHDETVRAKFAPDRVGSDGSGVTGSTPHTFATGTAAQWNDAGGINWGSGGKYEKASGSAVTDVSGSAWS